MTGANNKPLQNAPGMSAAADAARQEESVRESEERFRQLADHIDEIFWIASVDLNEVLYVSPACNQIWGRPPETFYGHGRSFLEDVHPDDREYVRRDLPRMARENYVGSFRIVRPDGAVRTIRVRGFPVRNERGEIYRVAGLTEDITEAKQAEDDRAAQRRFLEHLLRVQEAERKLTAYDIHDGFVQAVIGAVMYLEAIGNDPQVSPTTREKLAVPLKLLRESIDEARRMISGLRPPIIDEQGLAAAIAYLISEAVEHPIQITFEHTLAADRFEPIVEATLFRIAQEALNNVFRHSQARRAHVALAQDGDKLRLVVEDWGVGFDTGHVAGRQFGLRGIRERAKLLGGKIEIESTPGRGTRLCVELPLGVPFSVQQDG